MHKVDIEYIDYFNDNKKAVETFYFNINAFELAEVGVEFDGDLGDYMRQAFGDRANYKDGFKVLKMLFIKGYGRRVKSTDDSGRWRFVKNPAWLTELLPSPEFEAFYLKLTDDTEFAVKFWNGLVSEELLRRAKLIEENGEVLPAATPKNGDQKVKFRDLPAEEQVRLMREKVAANGIALDD